jgi:amino acid adenylation domain-containing protein
MTIDPRRFEGMDAKAKRELLASLLKERASGSGETFELSLGQEALFFLYRLAPQAVSYNVVLCGRIRAKIDFDRMESALLKLLERHPILRCTFTLSADGPRQRIGQVPTRCLEVIDASPWAEQELHARVDESFRRPFDLANGPVFRASLFTRNDTDHVLLITVHHIAFDAWSAGIIFADLAILYEGGSAASLPPPPASYADFVKWQRRMLASDEGRDAWDYWRSRLEGSLTSVDLPSDHLRPKAHSFRGGTYQFELHAALCAQLRALARAENATPYIVLAAAFHALFHRYTGSPQVPIGMPLAGRSRQEFENIVGYFVNPVVLCARVESETTFRQHVAEMREAAIGAQRYGDFPFPELVKRLQPRRDHSGTPLFQVMLNMIKSTQVGLRESAAHLGNETLLYLGSLPVEEYPLAQQEGQFELDMTVLDTGGAMPALLRYSTDLFESGTIERMAGHFVTLLEAAVSEPDRRVSDLPWLTEAERRQVLVEWNATSKSYPETTIHRLIEEQVRRTPDAVALVFEGRTMSYGELNRRANQLARHLRGLGVGPDTLVGLCIERSFEMVVGLLGILKSGGAYVPVDPGYPPDRQSYMIADSRAPVLLTQASLAGGLADSGARVVVLDAGWEEIVRHPDGDLEDGSGPGHLAYVIYTSGSTGKPKGAMNEHRAVCNRLLWMQDTYGLTASDRILQKTPFSFDVSVWEFFWPLMTGARLVIAHPEGHKDPSYLVHRIREEGITTLHFVPSMLRAFLEAEGVEECSSVKRVICSGEALPYELQERFFGRLGLAELHNLYGPTEAAVDVTWWPCERGSARKVVPIGRPVANTQMYVLDCSLNPVPVGVPGELYIGGVQVGRGYWGRPELTAEKFIPDPFRPGGRLYKTGDLSRWLPDGVIEYLGRNDFQVKVRGLRIELGEIEAALSEHVTVGQAVVVSREETPGDVRLVAYLVPRADASPSVADLRVFLKDRLPEYMIPSAFVILPSLPLNPSGKVDRKALPAPERMRSSLATQYEAPRTEVEAMIAELWKDVLRLEKVGVHDNFFDLGGHSLLLVQVQARLERHLKRKLAVVDLFQYPSIETLSRHLTSDEDVAPARERIDSRADRQRQAMSRHRDRKGQEGGTP